MRIFTILLVSGLAFGVHAQEVDFHGTTYKIKGDAILKDGADVTSSLSIEEQKNIKDALSKQQDLEKEREAAEKKIKKAEKEQKRAEKVQKKAEMELKQKEKAQAKFEKTGKDYENALSKYEKQKRKGKLSPNDEEKWLDKIQDLRKDHEKAKRKL